MLCLLCLRWFTRPWHHQLIWDTGNLINRRSTEPRTVLWTTQFSCNDFSDILWVFIVAMHYKKLVRKVFNLSRFCLSLEKAYQLKKKNNVLLSSWKWWWPKNVRELYFTLIFSFLFFWQKQICLIFLLMCTTTQASDCSILKFSPNKIFS